VQGDGPILRKRFEAMCRLAKPLTVAVLTMPRSRIRLSVATTTTFANVEALLRTSLGPGALERFAVIGAADNAARKKPAADIYEYVLRELDLSHFSKLPKDMELAGWLEWKYRTESLYSHYPQDGETTATKHPLAHPLLLKYSTGGHDVPLGHLMHIVKACPHLRYPTPHT
jgi:hypothetical protein